MELDYRYFKAFLLVAEHLNFSKAAKELRVAQSAVSRQVKLLEESIGKQLIIRSSKNVVLTDMGKLFYRCLQNFEEIALDIIETNEDKEIRIGILHGLLENWLIKVIEAFAKNFKNPLNILVSSPPLLKDMLEEGKIDIAFNNENIQSELVSSLKLFEEKYTFISKDPFTYKEFEKETWIVYDHTDPIFKLSNKISRKIIYVASMTSIVSMVKKGLGIAYVPKHIINKEDKLNIHEIKNPHINGIFCSTLNFQRLPKHLENFIEIAKKIK